MRILRWIRRHADLLVVSTPWLSWDRLATGPVGPPYTDAPSFRQMSRELVEGAGSFLSGSYAEHLKVRRTAWVPVWAWTNLLAHASLPELQRDAADGGKVARDEWRRARSYVAAEMAARCRDEEELQELQRTVLRPLQLDLITQDLQKCSVQQWVRVVLTAIRSSERHSSPAPGSAVRIRRPGSEGPGAAGEKGR